MDSYTVTITPNDESGNSTTLIVDTSTGRARITNVQLHAPDGLTGGQMPSVDVGLLLQAVTGPIHAPTAITATSTPAPRATQEPASTQAATRPTVARVDVPPTAAATTATPKSTNSDTTPPARALKRANPRRAAAARTAKNRAAEPKTPTSSSAPRGRNQPAPKKTARKQATAATTAVATASGTGRVYRKMPDDFAAVYRQANTPAAIADHYDVPRHTAHSWISRFKKQSAATGH